MMPRRTLRAFASRFWVLIPLAVLGAVFLGCSGGGGGGPTEPPPPPGGDNHAPSASLDISKPVLNYSETATLTVTASDVDGDQLTKSWTAVKGTVTSSGPTANTATFTAGTSYGPASATVTVTDGKGGSTPATAQTYIRNPATPVFTLGAGSSSTCGYGTSTPDGFLLTITPAEDVLITNITIRPDSPCTGSCTRDESFYPEPLVLNAGVTYTMPSRHCLTTGTHSCCYQYDCGRCSYFEVWIVGRRPAPDGGEFTYTCRGWYAGRGGC